MTDAGMMADVITQHKETAEVRSDNRRLIILSIALPIGIALLPIIVCLLSGCAAAGAAPSVTVSDYDLSIYKATVALSAVGLDKPDDVTPGPGPTPPKPKVPRSQCKVCNGTGKCRSGDGLLVWDCTNCEPDKKAALLDTEIPFGTTTYHGPSEVAEAPRTLRTAAPACDCATTGLCECGDACTCAGPRTRVAYLYTTAGCQPCQRAKEAIKAAAKSGRLPGDVRIVIRTDAPSWVRAFPTIHFQAGMSGPWVKTHEVETLLRDVNGLKAGLASDTPPVTSSAPVYSGFSSSISCDSGTCFGGGCSVGSCSAMPFQPGYSVPQRSFGWSAPAQSWGGGWSGRSSGWSGGFSSGSGCANCGR